MKSALDLFSVKRRWKERERKDGKNGDMTVLFDYITILKIIRCRQLNFIYYALVLCVLARKRGKRKEKYISVLKKILIIFDPILWQILFFYFSHISSLIKYKWFLLLKDMIYFPFSLNDDKINYDSTALIYGAPLPKSMVKISFYTLHWKIISYVVVREMSNLKGQSFRIYKLYHFRTYFFTMDYIWKVR